VSVVPVRLPIRWRVFGTAVGALLAVTLWLRYNAAGDRSARPGLARGRPAVLQLWLDPRLAALRRDPRFTGLARRLAR